jgi:hypothetical protein
VVVTDAYATLRRARGMEGKHRLGDANRVLDEDRTLVARRPV